jgi:nucleoside-diphosphate-sugar epimerase
MKSRMRVLVLGATGGTGRAIVSQALDRGHEVVTLVRSLEKARDLKGAKLVVGEGLRPSLLHKQTAQANLIFKLPIHLPS